MLANDPATPMYMYLAFMAVHDGCVVAGSPFAQGGGASRLGKQAPLATVERYNTTVLDTYKVAGAMYTVGPPSLVSVLRLAPSAGVHLGLGFQMFPGLIAKRQEVGY